MVKVVEYKKELLEGFVYDGSEAEFTGEQIIPMVEFYNKLGEVYLAMADDKVIAIGGIYPMWKDAGGCFLFANKVLYEHKISFFKNLLLYTKTLISRYGIKTLIAECLGDSTQAVRLITHLGFIKNKEFKMAMFTKENKT